MTQGQVLKVVATDPGLGARFPGISASKPAISFLLSDHGAGEYLFMLRKKIRPVRNIDNLLINFDRALRTAVWRGLNRCDRYPAAT